jgi:hypothetical protein
MEESQDRRLTITPEANELLPALAAAQGEVGELKKNATNPHYQSQYADLSEVISSIKEALANNGLSVVENTPVNRLAERFYVVRMTLYVFHASGQYLSITTDIPCMKGDRMDAQSIGTAITYGRRYLLQCMFNLAGEDDDDGNAIEGSKPQPRGDDTTYAEKTPSLPSETPQNGFASIVAVLNTNTIPPSVKPEIMRRAKNIKNGSDNPEEYEELLGAVQDSIESEDWSWL